MTTPSFDSVESQASYGIGLQVGQQLQESGLQGLQPEALLAGLRDALEGNSPAVPVDVVHRALREVHERAEGVRRERTMGGLPARACITLSTYSSLRLAGQSA